MPSPRGTTVFLTALLATASAAAEDASSDTAEEPGVCLLQHTRAATKSCVSKHDDGQQHLDDLRAVGTAYQQVDELIDRHHDLSTRMQSVEHRGQELKEARELHAALGKSIKKIRQDSESLLELASKKGRGCELRAALRGLESPVGDLSKGLQQLDLLQVRASEKQELKSLARHPDRDIADLGKMYDSVSQLMDRHHVLSEEMRTADHTSQKARMLHATIGNSIRSIRKKTESLMQLGVSEGNRGKLRSALEEMRQPVSQLNTGLDKLAMLQQAADSEALGRLAKQKTADAAAVGAMFQKVDGVLDRHQKVLQWAEDKKLSGENRKKANGYHVAVGKAIKQIRKETESLMQIAATPGSNSHELHSTLSGLQRPIQALQYGLDELEKLHE